MNDITHNETEYFNFPKSDKQHGEIMQVAYYLYKDSKPLQHIDKQKIKQEENEYAMTNKLHRGKIKLMIKK